MTLLPDRYGAFPVEETREVEAAGRGDEWAARERIHTVYARPIPDPEPEPRPAPHSRRGSWVMPFVIGYGVAMVVAIAVVGAFGQLAPAGVLAGVYLALGALAGLVHR